MSLDEPGPAGRRIEGVLRNLANSESDRELVEDIVAARLFGAVQPIPEIGRFTLLGLLGRGGMGTVYAAHDPKFDRKVAIKVVRASPESGESSESASARLIREARIVARLAHPNVVAIHETGVHQGDVFVVMELVEGMSLGEWVVGRSWAEIVAMYLRAGEGLAAAHAAGMVHRDFKPANVLVDGEGRPRVVDFGLARVVDLEALARLGPLSGSAIDYSVTATGRVCGTPGFMAPELFAGTAASPGTDQYAFCVSLLETLKPQGKPSTVPEEIIDVLLRGLAPDPAARWPDMHALLSALRRASRRPSRRKTAIATAAVLAMLFAMAILATCS